MVEAGIVGQHDDEMQEGGIKVRLKIWCVEFFISSWSNKQGELSGVEFYGTRSSGLEKESQGTTVLA